MTAGKNIDFPEIFVQRDNSINKQIATLKSLFFNSPHLFILNLLLDYSHINIKLCLLLFLQMNEFDPSLFYSITSDDLNQRKIILFYKSNFKN